MEVQGHKSLWSQGIYKLVSCLSFSLPRPETWETTTLCGIGFILKRAAWPVMDFAGARIKPLFYYATEILVFFCRASYF